MFILEQGSLRTFDPSKSAEFIECWSRFYVDRVRVYNSTEVISYSQELNLGHDLSPENLKRLLRWKDPQWLTEEIYGGTPRAAPNQRVQKALLKLDSINAFHSGRMSPEEFRAITAALFPYGIVWQIFLFHVARPAEYPIADRYVFRTARTWTGGLKPKAGESWADYESYKRLFFDICEAAGILEGRPALRGAQDPVLVLRLKRVDDALMAYGKFLEAYLPELAKG